MPCKTCIFIYFVEVRSIRRHRTKPKYHTHEVIKSKLHVMILVKNLPVVLSSTSHLICFLVNS